MTIFHPLVAEWHALLRHPHYVSHSIDGTRTFDHKIGWLSPGGLFHIAEHGIFLGVLAAAYAVAALLVALLVLAPFGRKTA